MRNKNNLKPIRSKEEARELGRKGGIKSGESRRKKRTMRHTLKSLICIPLKDGKSCNIDNIKSFAGLKGTNVSVEEAMLIMQVQKALNGDLQAVMFIRDTIGEKPDDKLLFSGELNENPFKGLTTDELIRLANNED